MITALDQAEPFGRDHGIHLQVTMPVPPCVIEHEDYPHVSFGGCPIGTEMQELALGPRGELRNCTLHTEVVGELSTTSMATLVEGDRVMHYRDVTPEFCAPCPHKRTCVGGCGASGVAVLGKDNPLGDEGAGAFGDVLAVLVEHLEEVAFLRQQFAEKHGMSPGAAAQGRWSSVGSGCTGGNALIGELSPRLQGGIVGGGTRRSIA